MAKRIERYLTKPISMLANFTLIISASRISNGSSYYSLSVLLYSFAISSISCFGM